ncbi:MAG: DUF692 domain-containing protein [Gammaproteobacteria bacterium]
MKNKAAFPYLGFGLGLRSQHYETILTTKPVLDWFEVITENYIEAGGKPLFYLDKIRELYPIVMHGVALSIGGTDPLDKHYLQQVKNLRNRIEPMWISDHLCWTGVQGINTHDLLPMPYTMEAVKHIVSRIHYVQEYFGQQILLENVSSYITYTDSEMSEWDFINEISSQADCMILLDINNVYINAFNHGFDAYQYLDNISSHRVKQFHLAGHSHCGNYLVDTHDADIIPVVWALYDYACRRFGHISVMIERDDNIPPLADLLSELDHARNISNDKSVEILL